MSSLYFKPLIGGVLLLAMAPVPSTAADAVGRSSPAAAAADADAKANGQASPATAAAANDPQAGSESGGASFDIWEYRVEGNTLLPTEDVERAVYGHLGPKKSIKDVEAAQKQLEDLYHQRGYGTVFVDIPEQDVVGGVVRLKVTEGSVEWLRVTGSHYFSLGRIKSGIPSLAKGKVPYLPEVQKELGKLNQKSADRSITPVLRPGLTPGKLEVELKVKDQLPLHGNVEVNDRYSEFTSHTRVNTNIRYDNLWQREHSLALSYQVAPENPDEVQVFSGTYVWRFEDSDNLLALYGVHTNSNVATVGTLGVLGSGDIAGFRYTIPLRALDDYFHNVSLGADYKDFGTTVGLPGTASLRTPIDYLMFATQYNGTWLGKDTTSHLSIGVNFAVRGLCNTEKEFENDRFKARPNFAYLHLNADRLQPVWGGASVFARLQGQIADQPLIGNEQFGVGGVDTVRGYQESQILGDDGVAATFELRSPSLAGRLSSGLDNLQLLTFVDGAAVRLHDPLPGTAGGYVVWSTGLGMRLNALKHISASLVWAWALKDFTGNGIVRAGDSRMHFDLGYDF